MLDQRVVRATDCDEVQGIQVQRLAIVGVKLKGPFEIMLRVIEISIIQFY